MDRPFSIESDSIIVSESIAEPARYVLELVEYLAIQVFFSNVADPPVRTDMNVFFVILWVGY